MVYAVAALLVILADQLTKHYVVSHFVLGESVPVLENIFHWTFILNSGAAFGMMEGSRWLFVLIGAAVIAGIWYLRRDIQAWGAAACWGAALFSGGAVGNLIDRIRQGLVVDFFDFRIWLVFNVSYFAICTGLWLIIWSILKKELADRNK